MDFPLIFVELGHSGQNTIKKQYIRCHNMLEFIFEIFLLVTALSIDAFAAGFAYGVSRTRIPFSSLCILTSISSLILAFSLLAGNLLTGLLTPQQTCHISFIILLLLGIAKLFDHSCCDQADKADKDRDKLLSPIEAVSLGFALSIDSLAAGIGALLPPSHIPAAIVASFFMGLLAILSGSFLGKKISCHVQKNLCWISGVLLIFLAFLKLF